jgi:hypothetical protein
MSEEEPQVFEDDENLKTTLELQRRLLSKTKTDKTNTLLKKSTPSLYFHMYLNNVPNRCL